MRTKWIPFALLALLLLIGATLPVTGDPLQQNRDAILAPPSAAHWFGTDDYGRDLFSRFLHGGRWSILAGGTATALCLVVAWIIGGWAGVAPRASAVLMWFADLFLCLPWVYLVIAARAALPLDLPPRLGFTALLLLLALTGWARPARQVRGKVLETRERGYVNAALRFGVAMPVVFWRHILPATRDLLLAQTLLLLPRFVLAELTLSFLGAGTPEPLPSWGALIVPLKQLYALEQHWWLALPILTMMPFFAVCALCGRILESGVRLSR